MKITGEITTSASRIIAIITLLLLSCSSKPTEIPGYNVTVNCLYPSDPLFEIVETVSIRVSASDLERPYDTTFAIEPGSIAGSFSLDMNIESGLARLFRVCFKDNESRVLFSSRTRHDIPSSGHLGLDLAINQSGFGTASSVIIFRDMLPWDSHALDSAMAGVGFSIGAGENRYSIYTSSDMGAIEIRPGIDLVIISNDQPQAFYDSYAANGAWFDEFINGGGTLLWCACDMGWNYGSIIDAGVVLPGSIAINYSLDQANLASNDGFGLLGNMVDTLYGNYASQEFFTDLPFGTIEYMTNLDGEPSLIGIASGEGWVIISGQPLEYNYDRKDTYNIGVLLPRLIRFLLGMGSEDVVSLLPGPGTLSENSG